MVEVRRSSALAGSPPKKPVRVGARRVLTAAFALALALLFSAAHVAHRVSVSEEASSADVHRHRGDRADPPPRASGGVPPPPSAGRRKSARAQRDAGRESATANAFHFVVSSDCTSYQRWEVLTQLHSAGDGEFVAR